MDYRTLAQKGKEMIRTVKVEFRIQGWLWWRQHGRWRGGREEGVSEGGVCGGVGVERLGLRNAGGPMAGGGMGA